MGRKRVVKKDQSSFTSTLDTAGEWLMKNTIRKKDKIFQKNADHTPLRLGGMKLINITMTRDNVAKIFVGEKWSTLRTQIQADQIGLKPGEIGITDLGGRPFYIRCEGRKYLSEVKGGRDAIWESEGFGEDGPKFDTTEAFLAGKRSLYVYTLAPLSKGLEAFKEYKPLKFKKVI